MTAQPGCVRVTRLPDGQCEKSAQFAGVFTPRTAPLRAINQREPAQVTKIA
jgi:hypothetical protein